MKSKKVKIKRYTTPHSSGVTQYILVPSCVLSRKEVAYASILTQIRSIVILNNKNREEDIQCIELVIAFMVTNKASSIITAIERIMQTYPRDTIFIIPHFFYEKYGKSIKNVEYEIVHDEWSGEECILTYFR